MKSRVYTTTNEMSWQDATLPHSDLDWGSVRVRYGPDPEDEMGVIHMHGHAAVSDEENPPNLVNVADGSLGGLGSGFKDLREAVGYQTQQYDISYQHATSPKRLVRTGITDHVNLAWWGAPKGDPSDPQTADPTSLLGDQQSQRAI